MSYKIAKRIVEENQCEELSISMLIPLPGTKVFYELRAKHYEATGQALPLLTDEEDYQRLWFQYMCPDTTFDDAVGHMYNMLALTPVKSTFGSPKLYIAPSMPNWNQLSADARIKLFDGKPETPAEKKYQPNTQVELLE